MLILHENYRSSLGINHSLVRCIVSSVSRLSVYSYLCLWFIIPLGWWSAGHLFIALFDQSFSRPSVRASIWNLWAL